MDQVLAHKLAYVAEFGEPACPEYFEGQPATWCQSCGDLTPLNKADFSHKKAAGMGGAGDVGGVVLRNNGTWSCRCCHSFIEQDIEARNEHQHCEANMENGQRVEYSNPVKDRLQAWRRRWYGRLLPEGKA